MAGRGRARLNGDIGRIQIGTYTTESVSTGKVYGKDFAYRYARGREWMIDAVHAHWRTARRTGMRDAGGPMHHFKAWMEHHPALVSLSAEPGFDARYKYEGSLYPFPLDGFILGDDHFIENSVLETSVVAQGTIGYARYKPNAPGGGLGQFLGELHDLPRLPALFRHYEQRAGFFAGLGSEYLNIEFGWRPFIHDLHVTLENALSSEQRLYQLARDNGRMVRRRGTVSHSEKPMEKIDRGYSQFSFPPQPSFFLNGPEHGYIELTEGTRYNFSAAFRYWIPTQNLGFQGPAADQQRRRLARIIYGVELNPRLVYQLMPWSWLGDWGTSLGAMVSNYTDSAADSLVADYAYSSGTKWSKDKWVVEGTTNAGRHYTSYTSFNRDMKRRLGATPYGFGIFLPDLSVRRLAILAALGFTRFD